MNGRTTSAKTTKLAARERSRVLDTSHLRPQGESVYHVTAYTACAPVLHRRAFWGVLQPALSEHWIRWRYSTCNLTSLLFYLQTIVVGGQCLFLLRQILVSLFLSARHFSFS
jgi:hypothetical protein